VKTAMVLALVLGAQLAAATTNAQTSCYGPYETPRPTSCPLDTRQWPEICIPAHLGNEGQPVAEQCGVYGPGRSSAIGTALYDPRTGWRAPLEVVVAALRGIETSMTLGYTWSYHTRGSRPEHAGDLRLAQDYGQVYEAVSYVAAALRDLAGSGHTWFTYGSSSAAWRYDRPARLAAICGGDRRCGEVFELVHQIEMVSVHSAEVVGLDYGALSFDSIGQLFGILRRAPVTVDACGRVAACGIN
jgi:hypothetical protein